MNLRSRCTRALSSLASLPTQLQRSRASRFAVVGICACAVVATADATRSHHNLVHHRSWAHRTLASHNNSSAERLHQTFSTLDAGSSSLASDAWDRPADPNAHFELRMHHLHTGEDIDVVYRIGNEYIPAAIAKLNYFLRDHRTEDVSHYDVHEFDLLHDILARLGKPQDVIDVVCGYRTPWSNNFLRTRSAVTGVAKNSQHMQAKAIDIRIPGVSTSHLRDVALSFHGGGVGYYPVSQFVHVDVGPVRQWSFGGRGE